LDWDQLINYALRVQSQVLVQRLGYLTDLLDIPLAPTMRDQLLGGIGKSTPYLGRIGQWGAGGAYDNIWRIVDNIPRQELLSELRFFDRFSLSKKILVTELEHKSAAFESCTQTS